MTASARGVLVIALHVLAFLGASCASAGASKVGVALLSEEASVQPGRPFSVGLQMRIPKGWHTYWKNPGDSGLPPKIAWTLPEGFSAGPIEWPAPERIPENTLMSYGYTGEVLLPVVITPPARLDADSVTLAGTFEWLECADVCLPASSVLRLSLPVRPAPPARGPAAPSFSEARARLPAPPDGWTFDAGAGPRAISLEFKVPPGVSPGGGYLFVDQPLVTDYAAAQGFERIAGGYRLTLVPAANAQGPLERLTGVLVTESRSGTGPGTAVRVDVPVVRGGPAPAPLLPAGPRLPPPGRWVVAALAGLGFAIVLFRAVVTRRKKSPSPREPGGGVDGI